MTPAESWELTRHLATQLGSSFALPRGSKCSVKNDYCASGLECRRELCQPKLLRREDCATPEANGACEKPGGIAGSGTGACLIYP
eukprot:s3424_g5.t1